MKDLTYIKMPIILKNVGGIVGGFDIPKDIYHKDIYHKDIEHKERNW